MGQMKAVFLDAKTLGADVDCAAIKALIPDFTCYDQTLSDDLIARAKDADIIITNKVVFNAAVLLALPKLKLICITATGTDNVDLAAAKAKGVVVKNVSGYSTASVAQHVMTLLFALSSNLPKYHEWTAAGHWQAHDSFNYLEYPIAELSGRKLGLIGYGAIAKQVQKIALAVGMVVLIAERPGATVIREGRLSFDEVIASSDVISLHCPLTADTKHLVNANVIDKMKNEVILINTSRGAVIDEDALSQAMNKGAFFGVGLDVLSTEPPCKTNPLLSVNHPNFILTPHIAWAADKSRARLMASVINNLREFL